MSQEHVNAILSKVKHDWSSLQQIHRFAEYAYLTEEEKKAFLYLDLAELEKFLDSASVRRQNTLSLAHAHIV